MHSHSRPGKHHPTGGNQLTDDQAPARHQLVRVDVGVDLVELSRSGRRGLHARARRNAGAEPQTLAKCAGTSGAEVSPPRSRSLRSRRSGMVRRRCPRAQARGLPAAATPGRSFRALGQRWPGGALLAVPGAVVRPPPHLYPAGSAIPGLPCPTSRAVARKCSARVSLSGAEVHARAGRARFGTDDLEHAALSRSQNTGWVP